MVVVAVTGSRKLTPVQARQVAAELAAVEAEVWHVGDAAGVDAVAWQVAGTRGVSRVRYEPKAGVPVRAALAERSTRMIKAVAEAAAQGEVCVLHGWPTRPAPEGLKPSKSWPSGASGSGTWGTIALAVGLGVEVKLHPLGQFELPCWLGSSGPVQMTLL